MYYFSIFSCLFPNTQLVNQVATGHFQLFIDWLISIHLGYCNFFFNFWYHSLLNQWFILKCGAINGICFLCLLFTDKWYFPRNYIQNDMVAKNATYNEEWKYIRLLAFFNKLINFKVITAYSYVVLTFWKGSHGRICESKNSISVYWM